MSNESWNKVAALNSSYTFNKRKLERRVRVVISEDLASQQQQQSRQKAAPVEQLHLLPFTKSLYSEVKTGETILKTSWNNHKLTKISKPRMRGKCVHCLKKASGDQPDLNKITTYCPQCPGGLWMCLECFDQAH
ncbi:uncharacterized protein LOC118737286 [Rhagoletis pomonella]|uniref:uncharacterized protein LOC118737286 n=1 Tax=Rhagoletis pomonella TaxID=28610 RepID=UPI00177EB919|nr:uncharacterized protein LOC118737286 [Rhagoletis pomonella]